MSKVFLPTVEEFILSLFDVQSSIKINPPLPTKVTPVWQQWKSNKKYSSQSQDNNFIILRFFPPKKNYKKFGYDISGHLSLQIGNDIYVSYTHDPTKTKKGFIGKILTPALTSLHLPQFKQIKASFNSLETDLRLVGITYKECIESRIEYNPNDPEINIKAMQEHATRILKDPPDYNFYINNCWHVCKKLIATGNKNNLWMPPDNIYPSSLLKSFHAWSKRVNHEEKPQTWQQMFMDFSKTLAEIKPEFAEHHFDSQQCVLNVPEDICQWFPFPFNEQPYSSIDDFIKHIQIIALALSRSKTLYQIHVNYIVQMIKKYTLTYKTNREITSILIALQPLINKLNDLSARIYNVQSLSNLRHQFFLNFKEQMVSKLFTTKEYDSVAITSDEQIDMFFIANGKESLYPVRLHEKYLLIKTQWAETIKNDSLLDHLNSIFKTVSEGLGQDSLSYSYGQLMAARKALRDLRKLRTEWKNKCELNSDLKLLPTHFYQTNEKILCNSICNAIQDIYFTDLKLMDAFRKCFSFPKFSNEALTIESGLKNTLVNLVEQADKFKFIHQQNYLGLLSILNNKNLSCGQKANKIAFHIKHYQPGKMQFWHHKLRQQYQKTNERMQLYLLFKAFTEGEVDEKNFLLGLQQHKARFSSKNVERLLRLFNIKFTEHTRAAVLSKPETTRKTTTSEVNSAKPFKRISQATGALFTRCFNHTAKPTTDSKTTLPLPSTTLICHI